MGKKEYIATQAFKRNGRQVQVGDPIRLSNKEALYLSLAGKVKKTEEGKPKAVKPKQRGPKRKKKKEIPSVAPVNGSEALTELGPGSSTGSGEE
jgi:hypothetical protein